MELSRSQRSRGQASFEFIVLLSVTLTLMVVFILSITNEYSDTFVVSSVKNVIQSEMSKIVIEKPDCQSTALVKMDFSATTKEIDVQTMGCRIDMSQVAETVETEMCGAKTPTGGQHLVCNGIDYWINEVYNG